MTLNLSQWRCSSSTAVAGCGSSSAEESLLPSVRLPRGSMSDRLRDNRFKIVTDRLAFDDDSAGHSSTIWPNLEAVKWLSSSVFRQKEKSAQTAVTAGFNRLSGVNSRSRRQLARHSCQPQKRWERMMC